MPSRPPAWNFARFDLVSIRLVVDCVRHGSLSAAAAQAHLALAAASRRMRELEAAVGDPLFERHGRGLRPTAAGRLFHQHALGLLQSMDQMAGDLADLRQGVARRLRLAASTAAINQFLPPLLARYSREHPQVRIELQEQVSQGVVAALREGSAEAGVFVEGVPADGLRLLPFRRDELVLVMPTGHALARRGPVAFSEALDQDWISLSEGAAATQMQQQASLLAGRPLKVRMQVRSFDSVCHLVASGLGVALLPRAAAEPIARAMGLKTRPLADPWAQRRLVVATRDGAQEPAVEGLVAFLAAAGEVSQNAKPARHKRQ